MLWYLFYYNSLPDMPKECSIFSNKVMHRDFFMCNPTNTGHWRYPRFENMSYDEDCHHREVKKIVDHPDPDKFVIFYTRHTKMSGKSSNKIIGYYKVGSTFKKPRIGFFASEKVILAKEDCIQIDYRSRGVPVSYGQSKIKSKVNSSLDFLRSERKRNLSNLYQSETKCLMELLSSNAGRKSIINICEKCNSKLACNWGKVPVTKKIERLENLYGGKPKC